MLTAFPDGNRRYDIIKGVVYTEDIHIVVVLTGVLVFLECLASILSFWYHLGLRPLIRATHIKDLKDWHVPIIVVLTVGSILHATWIFMLVRRIWVSHFFVLIQFLQAVPNILLVTQSISQGNFQSDPCRLKPIFPDCFHACASAYLYNNMRGNMHCMKESGNKIRLHYRHYPQKHMMALLSFGWLIPRKGIWVCDPD